MPFLNNPFGLTKANDLTDEQILSLWVDVEDQEGARSLLSLARPSSPMPMFILGGKGSGKTHLMRYCSYPIQKMRFSESRRSIREGLEVDGYIGIYLRCSGLMSGRFSGKGQSAEAWTEVFSYYAELWLGRALLRILPELIEAYEAKHLEAELCVAARKLFDANLPTAQSISELIADLEDRQRRLDFQVNNAAFTGELKPEICVTRGRLIFGLPKIIAEWVPALNNIMFSYQLDEYENLTVEQQRHVNTLVRERESPATFKVGGRSFGVKTRATFSADEENLKDSEYEELRLDEQFRRDKARYKQLARRLLQRRLEEARDGAVAIDSSIQELASNFDQPDMDLTGQFFEEVIGGERGLDRAHLQQLQLKLMVGMEQQCAPGVKSEEDIRWILSAVSVPESPLLERLNVMLIYQAWANEQDLPKSASGVKERVAEYREKNINKSYATKLQHYKSDIVAQLLRENRKPQVYTGMDTFIDMSEGQPRALLTLLKQIFDWSDFQGEAPFVRGKISVEAQRKGAVAAADWFYNSMTKAGRDGAEIILCVDRLAELFRINRFADNPIECSLIGFSGNLLEANEAAQRVIRLAQERSFLVEILGGQSERNSERVTSKLQLNRMLVPRWRLPTARRGIATFGARELNAIFDPNNSEGFEELRSEWDARGNAPFFGRRRGRLPAAVNFEHFAASQKDLFGGH